MDDVPAMNANQIALKPKLVMQVAIPFKFLEAKVSFRDVHAEFSTR